LNSCGQLHNARKTLIGGKLADTIDLDFDGTKITVANNLSPSHLKATVVSLQWLVSQLHNDLLGTDSLLDAPSSGSGTPRAGPAAANVVIAPDSDDDDEEIAVALASIENIKSAKDCFVTRQPHPLSHDETSRMRL
jgi:hypothetical protein